MDPVGFFAKINKLSAILRRDGAVPITTVTVLDTGAGSILVHKERTDRAWRHCIRMIQNPSLQDVYQRVMRSCGVSRLTVRVGKHRTKVSFLVI